jgi:hypothetical protein
MDRSYFQVSDIGPPGEENKNYLPISSPRNCTPDGSRLKTNSITGDAVSDAVSYISKKKAVWIVDDILKGTPYSPGGIDPVKTYMTEHNKVPAGIRTLDRYCLCIDMNLPAADLMTVINCKNCDFVGFPCLNCANYIFEGQHGPGNF